MFQSIKINVCVLPMSAYYPYQSDLLKNGQSNSQKVMQVKKSSKVVGALGALGVTSHL